MGAIMRISRLIYGVALATALSAAGSASAAVLWDNGPTIGAPNIICNSNAATCNGNGWTVYDDFHLNAPATVTGLTYDSLFYTNDYVSTNWSIWTLNPKFNWLSGPALSGTVAGINSADLFGTTLTTITGLNVALGAGTFWLGLQNNVSDGNVTNYGESSLSQLGPASQSNNSGHFVSHPVFYDAAFTIEGNATVTPLPSTWLMLLSGFIGIGYFSYRGTKKNAALAA
jgi:hypothetical protein